jgi:hypothetical protein
VVVTDDRVLDLQGQAVTVRGRDAHTETEDYPSIPYLTVSEQSPVTWLQWSEDATITVTLMSRTLPAETLARVAEGLTVEGSEVRLGPVPDGVGTTEIGRLDRVRFDSILYSSGGAAYSSDFRADLPLEDLAYGKVMTVAGESPELAMVRWLTAAAEPVGVRGHRGWTTRWHIPPVADIEIVVWEESDGVIGYLDLTGRPAGEATDLADDLVAATDAQWDAIPTMEEVTQGG